MAKWAARRVERYEFTFLERCFCPPAERIPVVAYCRPERGVILSATYGYRGSERDLRGSGIIPAGFLSPQAARMKLLACLASGLEIDEVRWAFRQDDG